MHPDTSSLVFLQYLTTVFDNIEDAIVLVSVEPKGHYQLLLANEGFYRNTGYQRTCVGKSVQELISEKGWEHLSHQFRKVVDDKKQLCFSHWYDVPLGRRSFDVKLIPVLNAVGEVVHIASISHNVTELEELREKVTETTKTLDDLTKALRTAV
jgi:PAS domain S-box-containing protein